MECLSYYTKSQVLGVPDSKLSKNESKKGNKFEKVFVTGTAGFIGYHLAKKLLAEGFIVNGFDGMTNYYDVELKKRRHQMLLDHDNFSCTIGMLEDGKCLEEAFDRFSPMQWYTLLHKPA